MDRTKRFSVRGVVSSSVTTGAGGGWVLYELKARESSNIRPYSVFCGGGGLGVLTSTASIEKKWTHFEVAEPMSLDGFNWKLTSIKTLGAGVAYGGSRCTIEWAGIRLDIPWYERLLHGVTISMVPIDMMLTTGDEVDISGVGFMVGVGLSTMAGLSIPLS